MKRTTVIIIKMMAILCLISPILAVYGCKEKKADTNKSTGGIEIAKSGEDKTMEITNDYKPELRGDIEALYTNAPDGTPLLVLRDPQRFTEENVVLTPFGALVTSYFDGAKTISEIAKEVSMRVKQPITEAVVIELAKELDRGLILRNEHSINEIKRIFEGFKASKRREPLFAGKAYPAEKEALIAFLKDSEKRGELTAKKLWEKAAGKNGSLRALIAPHIDPQRGMESYGAAYGFLRSRLPEKEILFVILGVAHNGVGFPLALLRKDYDTPLGVAETDISAVDFLAEKLGAAALADEFAHRGEHSIEFQALWLKYIMGERKDWKILPALVDSIHTHLLNGEDPEEDDNWNNAVGALRELRERETDRSVIFVLGVDFAHIGARFGDKPFEESGLKPLEEKDRRFIEKLLLSDEKGVIADIKPDFGVRKYCGLGPCYLMSRIAGETEGLLFSYGTDLEEGSLVSFVGAAIFDKK